MASEVVVLQLYIIRHAESEENIRFGLVDGVDYPHDDPPLTAKGVEQARLLGERMAHRRLDAIFSSPLTRAVHTAHEIALRQNNLKFMLLPDLMEIDITPGNKGCAPDILSRDFPLAVSCLSEPTPAGGTLATVEESQEMKKERAKRCIEYIRSRYSSGENVVLVSHGGFFGYLARYALGISEDNAFRFSANNASVSKIKFYENGMRKLSYSNDTSHFYASSPDMTYTI